MEEKAELETDIAAIEELLTNIERTLTASAQEAEALDAKIAAQTEIMASLQADTAQSLARFHSLKTELGSELNAVEQLKGTLASGSAQLAELRDLQVQVDEEAKASEAATQQLEKAKGALSLCVK